MIWIDLAPAVLDVAVEGFEDKCRALVQQDQPLWNQENTGLKT